MLGGVMCIGELSGGFDDDLGADGSPIKLGGIFGGENLDLLAVDGDGIGIRVDFRVEASEDGIVLKQMGEGLGVGEIINGDEFDVAAVYGGANDVAADAAEAVDAYFDCHGFSS